METYHQYQIASTQIILIKRIFRYWFIQLFMWDVDNNSKNLHNYDFHMNNWTANN